MAAGLTSVSAQQPIRGRHADLNAGTACPVLPCRISLEGTWRFLPGDPVPAGEQPPAPDDARWQPIAVPSNWYLQGHDLSGVAWYRHRFATPASLAGKTVRLAFYGVDYAASVWLNGSLLGTHEGYFQPFAFDVSSLFRPGQDNELVVRVDSPHEKPGHDWSLRKRLIKGIFNHHDTRPGGAWSERGQDRNTGGIWNSVELRVSDGVALGRIQVTPRIEHPAADPSSRSASRPGAADARATAEVRLDLLRARAQHEPLDIELTLAPKNFQGPATRRTFRVVALVPQTTLSASIPATDARLWWPVGHGKPNLYRLSVAVKQGGRVIERGEQTFGFRTVGFDAASGTWTINGRRLFLRGTNYIPTQWLSQMRRADYARDARLMLDAHINAVRVHAHVGAESFYEVCDAAGLLVWQDFALQWGYQDTPELHQQARRQALDMVELLYNHPSIVAWSMHNEPPWDATWMKDRYPDYDPRQNRELDEMLLQSVRAADTTRHVHMHSATIEHQWQGWYTGHWTDFAGPTTQPLITEFGAQALPGLASLRRFLADHELWPDSPADWDKWAYHNFQRHEAFEIAKIPMGNDTVELIRNTQAYQARLTRLAVESYRRQRYRPVGSIFQFMFVENWPSMNWGVLDYWRRPKAGYDALKTAYQPVLPSIEWQRDSFASDEPIVVGLWIVNDLWTRMRNVRYRWALRSDSGAELASGEQRIDIEPDSARKIMDLPRTVLAPGTYEVVTLLRAADGAALARNRFEFVVTHARSASADRDTR